MRLKSYVFAASDQPIEDVSVSLEEMEKGCAAYAEVALKSEAQLRLLLALLGLKAVKVVPLTSSSDFVSVFDFSGEVLPEFDKAAFDAFFDEWANASGNKVSMDEYGQLVFLQGAASTWNSRRNRFVLAERA